MDHMYHLDAIAVRAGSLVPVLAHWKSRSIGGMSFVYASRKYTAPKVQAFIQVAREMVASAT
jgi:DNA-binding transcriptional LysR family regulator